MSTAKAMRLRIPPALAGGRMLWLNRILRLCAQARAKEVPQVRVALDESLLQEVDHCFTLLDAKGSPFQVQGPGKKGWSEVDREAVFAATRDRIPGTAEAEPALDRFLPRPEETLLEAALELWPEFFEGIDFGVDLRFEAAGAEHCDWPDVSHDLHAPEVLWLSSRHRQTMRELGIELDCLLQGEEELLRWVKERDQGHTRTIAKRMREELDSELSQLRSAIKQEAPGLLGAWNRYRRAAKDAASDFARAAERFERNRRGIRGSRMHALAQAVRPADQTQEQGLSLLCAVALFRLQPVDAVEQLEVFHDPPAQGPIIVYSGTGISAPRSLS